MKFANYLNEGAGVKDLDSTVRKILREMKIKTAKFATTAIRGYHRVTDSGVMLQSDTYEFRVSTHLLNKTAAPKILDEFRTKCKEAGLTWKENHGDFLFNRKDNELPPEYQLSPEALAELLKPGRVLYQDRSKIREIPELDKIFSELSFKGLAETNRQKMPNGRGRPPTIVYRTRLTKAGEKARHLLQVKK